MNLKAGRKLCLFLCTALAKSPTFFCPDKLCVVIFFRIIFAERPFMFSTLLRWIFFLGISGSVTLGFGQTNPVPPTPAQQRLDGYRQRLQLKQKSLVKNVPFRSIGPSVQSERVVDIEGNPDNPNEFYVAYASGGVWHTTSNGIKFTPIFDNQPVLTIGDIAVDWAHGGTIWVGTGESNSSRSSYSGTGLYRSDDGGKTWQFKGLAETHHIGRIVIDPTDPQTLWVAAVGHLYSPNPERGVYKTTDGGQTWRKVLYVNENTGAIDLVVNPHNPRVLYAAMWERTRRAWDFQEAGAGSGIFKSTDGGEHWVKLNTASSGFPVGKGVGRIGLALSSQNPNIVYAFLDNQNRRPKEITTEFKVTKELLRTISIDDFLKLAADDVNDFLDRYDFPQEYNADTLFQLVRDGKIKPIDLVQYLEDANAQLFDTPVIGAEVYRSDDGGKTWHKTHEGYLDKVVYSFGYYFGNIRIDPQNDQKIYILGVPILYSADGGQHFTSLNQENVHVDHHALWIDPNNPEHLIVGNDGGVNISFDRGQTWLKANTPAVGQFYTVAVDMAKPYHVYGGLQDNGVWVGPSTHRETRAWQQTGHYAFKSIMGGDGMQVAVDTRDNTTVYTGFQFGNYFRVNRKNGKSVRITPRHKLGERPYRFNWQAPLWLSRHNQDILYLGAQKLFRSMDRGTHWQAISGDLTKGGKKGDVPYGTLTTIHESPLRFGLIYTGSDDGLVYVTRDGGVHWQRISDSLPQDYWVSRVRASRFAEGRVFVALNGYRWDNFASLLFVSQDYGRSWQRIGRNLPPEPINVVKEDVVNPHILYVGTDHGVYVSLDDGKTFMAFAQGLCDAPVHDLVVHPREHDLVVATHGRSLYLANMNEVEKLTPELLAKPVVLFPLKNCQEQPAAGQRDYAWKFIKGDSLKIPFYCKTAGIVQLEVRGAKNALLKKWQTHADAGLNYVFYDFSVELPTLKKYVRKTLKDKKKAEELKLRDNGKIYLPGGDYTLVVRFNGKTEKRPFKIKARPKKARKKKKKTP